MRRSKQQTIDFRRPQQHGGFRPGAGCKKSPTSGVSHRRRQGFSSPRPLHVTLRVEGRAARLRSPRGYAVVRRVFARSADMGGFRLVHYAVLRNHIHLIVEAQHRAALTRSMRCLAIRLAKQLNRALGTHRARVLADRYHEVHLTTPRQVRHALAYVLCNYRRHRYQERGVRLPPRWIDPMSSGVFFDGWHARSAGAALARAAPALPVRGDPVARPRTLMLRKLWRARGLVPVDTVPGV